MKQIHGYFCSIFCAMAIMSAVRAEVKIELITFADLVTAKDMTPQWSWHAIGVDPEDNVYAMFGGPSGPKGDLADCILVQYQARSGQRRYLGLLSDAAKTAGTLRPGEHIEKGHAKLLWQNGKMYLGTMGFHDAVGANSAQMKLALATHGAHLMTYDPKTDTIEDLSRDQPDGVFFPSSGFMTLSAMPERNLIIGYTAPHGNLLFYDTLAQKVSRIVPGVPEEFGRPVSREIVPTSDGKIYYAYGDTGGVRPNARPGHMYCYDLNTGERSPRPVAVASSFWNALARTKDGKGIYLTNQPGEVYQFHPETGTTELIGHLLPEGERGPSSDEIYDQGFPQVMGMAMSADEKYLYCIPTRAQFAKGSGPRAGNDDDTKQRRLGRMPQGVYAFEIATRQARRIALWPEALGGGYITGDNVRDSKGSIYFTRHHDRDAASKNPDPYGIIKVTFSAP